MKLGSVCYLPPNRIAETKAFLANIRRHPPTYPLYFYSDAHWKVKGYSLDRISNPEVVKHMHNAWSIPKLVFIEGINVAARHGLDYFIMLEDDCRVQGQGWDKAIFDEFFDTPGGLCGGTFYASNFSNDTLEWSNTFWAWATKFRDTTVGAHPSIMVFSGGGCAEKQVANIWTNGALTVYETDSCREILPWSNRVQLACSDTAYDVSIGIGLKEKYGLDVFQYLVPLRTMFSYYRNCLFSEQDRMAMLTKGAVRGVHHIKSTWTP